ncbi:putative bifunctional diguanylate cyclase/phosphodiesterase [Marinobacter sp. 1Y8]
MATLPMATSESTTKPRRRLKIAGLTAGLVSLVLLAVICVVAVIQIQAGITAYVSGQSIWSRAQVRTAVHFEQYARTGDSEQLQAAQKALGILQADRDARIAAQAPTLNLDLARQYFLAGQNHPDNVDRMIWLFRYFADFGAFKEAARVWRDSDPYLDELREIGEALQQEWEFADTNPTRIQALESRLAEANSRLQNFTQRFRLAMGEAARWSASFLSVASTIYLALLASLAWLLAWRLMRELRRTEQKFSAIFAQTAVGIVQIDLAGRILDANQATCNILERSLDKVVSGLYKSLVHPDDWELGHQQHQQVLEEKRDSYTVEQRLLKGNGDHLWARLTISMVRNQAHAENYLTVMLEDISESRRLASELSFQATHDSLTGLLNRRAFEYRLLRTLNRARADNSTHALFFIDLDQFKVVNDTSGHSAGDQLLRQVAEVSRKALREGDILARLGGDEFGVILESCSLEVAATVAEKLRNTLEHTTFTWEKEHHAIGCSIGVIPITEDAADINALMRAVDIACYMAKDEGRNRVYVSTADDQQLIAQRGQMEWLNRIQSALQEHRFFLDAQIISPAASNGESSGLRYEVLIRLTNEAGVIVPPSDFLPAAEKFGVINKIDRWVIAEAVRKLSETPDHLDTLEACHINLSGRSFDQADFADYVIDQIQRYKLPANKLCFEITETAAVHNLVDVESFMARLSKLGCTFALDDFGTGLSSFSYLRRLPVDCLKIDGAFVRDIAVDDTDLAMVRAINDIGHTLGKITIAEFVENDKTAALLSEMGVDYLQGFGLHRPCRLDRLLAGFTETENAGQLQAQRSRH